MNVTFWGVRGSIPTPQAENMRFGGETACVVLESRGEQIVLDAGSGIRRLGRTLMAADPARPIDILLSHFHWDHLQGLPHFEPLFAPRPLRFHARVAPERLHATLAEQMLPSFFPIALDAARAQCEYLQFQHEVPFDLGPFRVTPFTLHHPQGSTAFRVESEGRAVVYATDHEHGHTACDEVLLRYAQDADLLIADAQYTPSEYALKKGFGHSTWQHAAELALAAGVRRLYLFHHDPNRSDGALQAVVADARRVFPQTEAARERSTIRAGEDVVESADDAARTAIEQLAVRGLESLSPLNSDLCLKEHPLRVLLVDDQRMVGEAVRRMLLGYVPAIDFRFCADAAKALEVAAEFDPTLILQDLVMPGVEGLGMVQAFRENHATRDVPIIVLSSKEEAATKAASFAAGANDYIVKLPDRIELLARIQHHSEAYVHRLQRDDAYEALLRQQRELEVLLHQVSEEKGKSEALLLNILPEAVATELKDSGVVRAKGFNLAGVLFADFSSFTALSGTMTAEELVDELDECFGAFDRITVEYGVEKLKTIGDGYLCVAGVPEPRPDALLALARVALEIRDYVAARLSAKHALGKSYWNVRLGLHCGPLVAGVVGSRKFAYDVWGDTVNIASRMESAGQPGRVNLSAAYRAQLPSTADYEPRGFLPVKGTDDVEMFFLNSL